MNRIGPPSPRPCQSCPYRRDVASGVWAAEEYQRLAPYDNDTLQQPTAVFTCHQSDPGSSQLRVCAGWAGCHDGHHLLALRIAVLDDRISAEHAQAIADYVSPVPLFASARQAIHHGLDAIDHPGERARRTIAKIARVRSDLLD